MRNICVNVCVNGGSVMENEQKIKIKKIINIEFKEKDNAGSLTCTEPCLSAGVNVPPAPDCFTVSGHVVPTPLPPPPPTPPPATS